MKSDFNSGVVVGVLFILLLPCFAGATEFSSTNFRVKDPIFQAASSTEMSSTNFRLYGAVGQISVGTSTSNTFEVRSGFLYFPVVTLPTVSATAGDGQISLSWTVASGVLGWTVSGYNIGRATVSGGPYTYGSSVGSTTSSTVTGLDNGTTYYFIVRPEDAFGNSVATSSEVSATPAGSAATSATAAASSPGGGILETLLKTFKPLVAKLIRQGEISEIQCARSDFNCDGVVGINDLSIFLSLINEPMPGIIDVNRDNKIDIRDMGVLFSDWSEKSLTFVPERQSQVFVQAENVTGPEGFAFIGKEKPIEFAEIAVSSGGAEEKTRRFRTIIWVSIFLVLITALSSRWTRLKGSLRKLWALVFIPFPYERKDIEERIRKFVERVKIYADKLPHEIGVNRELKILLKISADMVLATYLDSKSAGDRAEFSRRLWRSIERIEEAGHRLGASEPLAEENEEKEALVTEARELARLLKSWAV